MTDARATRALTPSGYGIGPRPELLATQVTVVGAGAAGLYTALSRGSRGRVGDAGVGHAAGASPRAGGRRAGWPPRSRPRTAPSSTCATRSIAGRERACASRRRASCARRRPTRCATSTRLGVRFDADRDGRLALGLEGGHSARRIVHAGGAATGRRLVRQLGAVVAERPGIDVLEGRRVIELLVRRRALRRRPARRRAT